jgi:hypothetical protein
MQVEITTSEIEALKLATVLCEEDVERIAHDTFSWKERNAVFKQLQGLLTKVEEAERTHKQELHELAVERGWENED